MEQRAEMSSWIWGHSALTICSYGTNLIFISNLGLYVKPYATWTQEVVTEMDHGIHFRNVQNLISILIKRALINCKIK